MTEPELTPTPTAGSRRTVEEHAESIARIIRSIGDGLGAESVPVAQAGGRVAASAVTSPVDLPLFDNSQMDGFAVRAIDLAHAPAVLPVVDDVPAGRTDPRPLVSGTVQRIMTGAMLPAGADAVVPVEETAYQHRDPDGVRGDVRFETAPEAGRFVRRVGSDIARGDELVAANTLFAARHLAALSAAGVARVAVRRRARVAVVTTGAELVRPGEPVLPGQIYDSNLVAMGALVEAAGAEVVVSDSCDDDADALVRLLTSACGQHPDLILTSGGVSRGAFEVVRDVLEPRGGWFGTVAMQPGGPQATAKFEGVPVIGFPGNPVSTQVSFTVFVRDPLRSLAGLDPVGYEDAELADGVRSVAGKRQFLRGRSVGQGRVQVASGPSSHLVASMAQSDVLIEVPTERTELSRGERVRVWSL